jgi:alkylated DNA repair dioxygenase AlkB
MKETLSRLKCHDLGAGKKFWTSQLPDELLPKAADFEALWQLHPTEFHEIRIRGRLVKTPRWQQAYGVDYHYSGQINRGAPIPPLLDPFLGWSCDNIDNRLNGLLLNWYDGRFGHYIGRHRDSVEKMVPGAPIVTISLGEERTFRLRPWPAKLKGDPIDFPARHGTVFIMPWDTNLCFTHEVPAFSHLIGCRISITLRAF